MALKKLDQINPNLLIGGAIVGIVGLGAVLLWRALDPRQIPDKIKEAMWDPIVRKSKETTSNPYYKKDSQGNVETNWFGVLMTSINPAIGLMSLEAQIEKKKKEVEDAKNAQNTWDPSNLDPRL